MFDQEPEGYSALCARLRSEKDPEKFKQLLDRIDAVLRLYTHRYSEALRKEGRINSDYF